MNAERNMTDWFLKAKGDVRGPLSEAEMRASIEDLDSPELRVRQGQSDWYPADVIRRKLEVLKSNGIYIRFKQVAEGPFTLGKAYESLTSVNTDGVHVRMGSEGSWVKATKWIKAVDRLKRKQKDAVLSAVSELFDSAELLSDGSSRSANQGRSTNQGRSSNQGRSTKPLLPTDHGTVSASGENRGIGREDTPAQDTTAQDTSKQAAYAVNEEIVTASLIEEGPPAFPSSPPTSRPSSPSQPNQGQSAFLGPASGSNASVFHGDSFAGIPSHADLGRTYESTHPRARIKTNSADAWGRIVGFTLASLIFLMLGALIAKGIIKKNSLQYVESKSKPTLVDIGDTNRGNDRAEESWDNQGSSSQHSDPVLANNYVPAPSARPTNPPLVTDGMLFRPTIQTRDGVIDAGTAFAATIEGSSKTFLLTALHLFGPAGGLNEDMNPTQLPQQWQALTLRDCKSLIIHDEVGIDPILLEQTQPLPNPSAQGDVAACSVQESGFLRFKPLAISSSAPSTGEKVWLVSEVMGSRSLVHSAVVEGIEEGWAVYRFDEPIELRATSGAPIVDGHGQVVAVHAGGGNEGGAVVGIGTPTAKFANGLLESQ